MDDESRSDEVKRRLQLWLLTAVSGVMCTVGLSAGYWLVAVAIECRDHIRQQHVAINEHKDLEREVRDLRQRMEHLEKSITTGK